MVYVRFVVCSLSLTAYFLESREVLGFFSAIIQGSPFALLSCPKDPELKGQNRDPYIIHLNIAL